MAPLRRVYRGCVPHSGQVSRGPYEHHIGHCRVPGKLAPNAQAFCVIEVAGQVREVGVEVPAHHERHRLLRLWRKAAQDTDAQAELDTLDEAVLPHLREMPTIVLLPGSASEVQAIVRAYDRRAAAQAAAAAAATPKTPVDPVP